MRILRERLPADAILTNGAGNYSSWVHRFWPFRHYGTQLGADLRLDGLLHPLGGRREADRARSASSSPSPATAAS